MKKVQKSAQKDPKKDVLAPLFLERKQGLASLCDKKSEKNFFRDPQKESHFTKSEYQRELERNLVFFRHRFCCLKIMQKTVD